MSPTITPADGTAVVRAITVAGRLRLALNVAEVAELLFGDNELPTRRVVLRLIRDGQLPATSTGRAYVIPAESVLQYLATPISA